MIIATGPLEKMQASMPKSPQPLEYFFHTQGAEGVRLNPLLGEKLRLDFSGKIYCVYCQKLTEKSFHSGYCFSCFQRLAQCDRCILQPELCHFAFGTCRQPQWGETHCMIPHFVYLSYTSGVKVGITRHTQIPTRWIDQGATSATTLFCVQTRYQSGVLEVLLKEFFKDRTDWRKMLLESTPLSQQEKLLLEAKDRIYCQLEEGLEEFVDLFGEEALDFTENSILQTLVYPVLETPKKLSSLRLEKKPHFEGLFKGIKGQYLLFAEGAINIRNHSGYDISLSVV